jgi:NAD(P)-dependent dehydrogenase (short-subunit alcohol dehydrogenase family)
LLGRVDIVVANAGISAWGRVWELSPEEWRTMIDVNLTGVWNTLRCTIPMMIGFGHGGSIIITSSVGGLKPLPGQAHYVAAKHGLVGLAGAAAVELGPYNIRVNSIHPWGVDTAMGSPPALQEILAENPTYGVSYSAALAEPRVATTEDIANAVLFLASDQSRCITGVQLPVDMGATKV